MNKKIIYTIIGYLALFIWASSTYLMYLIHHIPTFEISAITNFISFVVLGVISLIFNRKAWKQVLHVPIITWVLGILMFLQALAFIQAFKSAPPINIELIYYLWPILSFIFAFFFIKEEVFRMPYVLALGIGFTGCLLVIFFQNNHTSLLLEKKYIPGELWALVAAVGVSLYVTLSRKLSFVTHNIITIYVLISAILASIFHVIFKEKTVWPNHMDMLILFTVGFATAGLAYLFWDIGLKKGNARLLILLGYGNPIISSIILITTKTTKLTWGIVVGTLLVSIAALIGEFTLKRTKTKS